MRVESALDMFPLFVKSGSVIAMNPVMQFTGEKQFEQLTLHVYYSMKRNHTMLYEDAGDGYDYREGKCSVKKFSVFGNRRQMRILQNVEGNYETQYKEYMMEVHCLPFRPKGFIIDGVDYKLTESFKYRKFSFIAPKFFKKIEIY